MQPDCVAVGGAVEGVWRVVDFIHSPVESGGGGFRDSALMGKGRVAQKFY